MRKDFTGMKKIVLITLAIIASLLMLNIGYAQGDVTVTTTDGSITADGNAVDAGESATVAPPAHVSWASGAEGIIAFPGGQSILVGDSTGSIVNEIQLVKVSSSATQPTQV